MYKKNKLLLYTRSNQRRQDMGPSHDGNPNFFYVVKGDTYVSLSTQLRIDFVVSYST
jgi:hypothetical protein